jgi:hypothetical protein
MEHHKTEINQIKNLIKENNQDPFLPEPSAFYRNLHEYFAKDHETATMKRHSLNIEFIKSFNNNKQYYKKNNKITIL